MGKIKFEEHALSWMFGVRYSYLYHFFGVCLRGKGEREGLSCVTLHDNGAFLSAAGIVYNVLRVCVGVILLVSDDVYTDTMATLIPGSLKPCDTL